MNVPSGGSVKAYQFFVFPVPSGQKSSLYAPRYRARSVTFGWRQDISSTPVCFSYVPSRFGSRMNLDARYAVPDQAVVFDPESYHRFPYASLTHRIPPKPVATTPHRFHTPGHRIRMAARLGTYVPRSPITFALPLHLLLLTSKKQYLPTECKQNVIQQLPLSNI